MSGPDAQLRHVDLLAERGDLLSQRRSCANGALGVMLAANAFDALTKTSPADELVFRELSPLEAFEEKWGQQLPVIGQAWRDAWEYVTPFMAFEPEVRRVIYTTNAIEALNRQLRKALKTKGSFPSEDAARKLIYLAIQNAVPQWTRTRGWTKALLAFKIQFGDRLPD